MRIFKRTPPEWTWVLAFALGVALLNRIVAATSTSPDCSLGVCPLPTTTAETAR